MDKSFIQGGMLLLLPVLQRRTSIALLEHPDKVVDVGEPGTESDFNHLQLRRFQQTLRVGQPEMVHLADEGDMKVLLEIAGDVFGR